MDRSLLTRTLRWSILDLVGLVWFVPQPTDFISPGSNIILFIYKSFVQAPVNCKCLPWTKQGFCQSFLLILCWLFSLSLQYGWLLFCSRLLRDFPFLCVGNNSLTVALTLFSKIKLLVSYYILHLEIIYSFYPKFSFCCSLQVCSTNFSLLVLIAEKLVQTKYISEPVSDPTPIISTCWACECNVGGTPPISSILLFTLGVLVPLLWNKVSNLKYIYIYI